MTAQHQLHGNDQINRVTVIGNAQISANPMDFLNLGPPFAPTQNISAMTFCKIMGGLHQLRDQLRLRFARENQAQPSTPMNRRLLPSVPFPSPFYREPDPCTEADVKFRIFSSDVFSIFNENRRTYQSSLTSEQRRGFKKLRESIANGNIRLSVSDNGWEFVVMPQSLDRAITENHLSGPTLYKRATEVYVQA
ncbi:hypothetical protein Y032_0079g1253 [Ancylostoma ceylanicum]|uniref:Uncharacterized protein n=1 Tax=Ancylostoma ceylanicum TaxID=53326 RepID=A0A016TT23_9BILA|nr:hypothetical protein Y032_0079g1253 [Ancylostoma ceylanicum]